MRRRRAAVTVAVAVAVATLALTACSGDEGGDPTGLGTPSPTPQPTTRTASPATMEPDPDVRRVRVVRTVASGLEVPWGVAFLPDGTALVSERDSTRVLAVEDGAVREVGRIVAAQPQGEAGLLGLAVSPTYGDDRLVYAYVSTGSDNRVVKMTYDDARLGTPEPVLTGIPNGFIHDGGRLLFAEGGNLFVSTGEIGQRELAQQPDSLGGKILRITP